MKHRLITLILIFLLAAPGSRAATPARATLDGILLLYREREPGTESYPVRILVVPEYLRIDEGHDQDDYLLFDRAAGTIYSVNHESRTILYMKPAPVAEVKTGIPEVHLGIEHIADADAPAIAGRVPEILRFTANGETCLEAAVVPGLLQPAVAALMEYGRTLAGRQRADLEITPEEFRTPCYLSRYIVAPVRHLEKGLPVREWNSEGYWRELTDFHNDVKLDPSLFVLPQDYTRQALGR